MHTRSDFYTYCESYAPAEEKDPESIYMQLLADKGRMHELQVVESIAPTIKQNVFTDNVEAFRFVIEEMFKGTSLLAGFPLFYAPLSYEGHIDLLRKNNNQQSIFGNYYYEIIEIKLARNIKSPYIMQAIFYNELIGQIQGYYPEYVYLINGEKNEIPYDYESYKDQLFDTINDIKAIRSGQRVPTPAYGSCPAPWTEYTNKLVLEKRDVTCIPDLGPSLQKKLYEKGITTIEDIESACEDSLLSINGIGKKKVH